MDNTTYVGLIVFAALFVLSGINHIRNHAAMVGYTASTLPESLKQFAVFGGAPTGIFLAVFGAASGFGLAWGLYGLAGFLVVATALFHRNFVKDPGGFKGVALAGAALALAQLVVH